MPAAKSRNTVAVDVLDPASLRRGPGRAGTRGAATGLVQAWSNSMCARALGRAAASRCPARGAPGARSSRVLLAFGQRIDVMQSEYESSRAPARFDGPLVRIGGGRKHHPTQPRHGHPAGARGRRAACRQVAGRVAGRSPGPFRRPQCGSAPAGTARRSTSRGRTCRWSPSPSSRRMPGRPATRPWWHRRGG